MPVFLEKHDFFKITAADIARIHQEDLRIQHKFRCYVLAYWFDQKRRTTFFLIDAPDLESVKEMHCHLNPSYTCEIIQIEEDLIEAFLNKIESTEQPKRNYSPQPLPFQESMCAVMVMKLYCSDPYLSKDCPDKKTLFEDFKNYSLQLVKKNQGRIIKSASDGCIYAFDSISQSLKSALLIQLEISGQVNNRGKTTFTMSIGVDGGRSINQTCDLYEETCKLAGRLCCIAGSNQIVVSSKVREQIHLQDLRKMVNNCNLKTLSYKDELFLSRLMEIIELNYREDFKIGDFCKIMGESRSQLYRKIIDVTNFSPAAWINEYRLKKATELMHIPNGNNVSQIAYEAGFNSLSYFSRRFKKRFGLLPSVYMTWAN